MRFVLGELAGGRDRSPYEDRFVATFQLGESIPRGNLALVASAWLARRRAAAEARNEHLAAVGERVDVEVEVVEVVEVRETERRSR